VCRPKTTIQRSTMELTNQRPVKSRALFLGSLPTLIQKPITELQRLSCIAGITTGIAKDAHATMLRIQFRNAETMHCNQALQCFSGQGLSLGHLQINTDDYFMMIQLSTSKFLSN